MSTTRQSLQEIFDRAGIARATQRADLRMAGFQLRRHLKRVYFAQCYVKNGFAVLNAYREFNPRATGKNWRDNAYMWIKDPQVCRFVREITQEATNRVKEHLRVDVAMLIQINETLIMADASDLVEEVETPSGVIYTRFKPMHRLSPELRMCIKKIKLKDGAVTEIELHDKLKAEQVHVGLLSILDERGGSDASWVQSFNGRMQAARKARIDLEVQAGKVIRLPGRAG